MALNLFIPMPIYESTRQETGSKTKYRRCEMSTITMDMSSYEVEPDSAANDEYGVEVLNAGWSPELALQPLHPSEHHELPRSLVIADVTAFINKMYVYQR